MFYTSTQLYLLRVDAPATVRAAVSFMHGLAAWDWADAARSADVLLRARPRGESWVPLSLLRQGGTLSLLMTGDVTGAERMLAQTVASGPQTLSEGLLAAHVVARQHAARAK